MQLAYMNIIQEEREREREREAIKIHYAQRSSHPTSAAAANKIVYV
jgi:hypothetical protein